MEVLIRQSVPSDFESIRQVVAQAFRNAGTSEQNEYVLIGRLRVSDAYIPELSIVAEDETGQIVGHIMLTRISVGSGSDSIDSLAMAPVSVLPIHQKQGIGSRLIRTSLEAAKNLGYGSVIVLGHPEFYRRFGFEKASEWGIFPPFDVPDNAFMALELQKGGLERVSGIVRYPEPFNESAIRPM